MCSLNTNNDVSVFESEIRQNRLMICSIISCQKIELQKILYYENPYSYGNDLNLIHCNHRTIDNQVI